jgi:acyl carrier protein
MEEKLYQIVNHILIKRKSSPLSSFEHNMSLRNDIGFDSLELAELTVRLENEFNIDIFEDGLVDNIGDVLRRLSN